MSLTFFFIIINYKYKIMNFLSLNFDVNITFVLINVPQYSSASLTNITH